MSAILHIIGGGWRAVGDDDLKRQDIHLWPENNRTIAAAVILQLHGKIDPDYSRTLAEKIVFAIDRAGMRGHTDARPTDDEIARAQNALARRGIAASAEDVAYVLDAAFVRGWGS